MYRLNNGYLSWGWIFFAQTFYIHIMTDPILTPTAPTPEELERKKAKKEEKKHQKMLDQEKTFLAFERTLLAWVRTSTNLLTFGFAIIKLLQDKALEPGKHPVLEMINPAIIGSIMVFAGFLGLLLATIGYVRYAREFGRKPVQIFLNQAMLVSYVILILSFLILVAPLMAKWLTP